MSSIGRRSRRAATVGLAFTLLAAPPTGGADRTGATVEGQSQDRLVALVLPGVTLEELLDPRLTTIPRLVRNSTGSWVVVWRQAVGLYGYGHQIVARTRRDPARPYGVVADYESIRMGARRALATQPVVWIEPGDTERAARYAPLCLPAKAEEHRRVALDLADRLLGQLLSEPGVRDVWLLAPALNARRGLTPLFWMRRGFGPGLLRSGSTRMTGVVTGPDVVATLAEALGRPYQGDGRRVEVIPWSGTRQGSSPVEHLQSLASRAEQSEAARKTANPLLKVALLLLVLGSIGLLATGRRLPGAVALAPLVLPTLLLLEAAVRTGQRLWALTLAALLLGSVAWTVDRRRRVPEATGAGAIKGPYEWQGVARVTGMACFLALVSEDLLRWSVMGHSVLLGVRFYGMGNEVMGWWVGALVVASGRGSGLSGAGIWVLLGTALLLAHPAIGADLGGGLTALGAAGVAAWPSLHRRRALLMGAVLAAAVLVLGLAVWDASRPLAEQTHLGRLAGRLAHEGLGPLVAIAMGKVATNLRLSLTLWGALLAAGAGLVLLAKRLQPSAPATLAVGRLLPVAAIAYLVNDSGVIAAALMLSYGVIAAADWRDTTERK